MGGGGGGRGAERRCMARWLLTILTEELEDTRMTLREGTLTTDRVTDATWSLILFFPFLRFFASIEGSRIRSNLRIRTEEDARDIPVYTCHAYVCAANREDGRVGINLAFNSRSGRENREVRGGVGSGWQFYGNACEGRGEARIYA